MAATPTYSLTDGSDTVTLEWTKAPETFRRRTRRVPKEVRVKLNSSTEAGRVKLLTGKPTKDGQTLTTEHRAITPADDAILQSWYETSEVISYNDGSESHSVCVYDYQAGPRNVLHHWDKTIVVETLVLMFFEDE